jgi:hypothetical protein
MNASRNGTVGPPRACLIPAPLEAPRCRKCEHLREQLAAERHAALDLRLRLDALRVTQGEIVSLLSRALDELDGHTAAARAIRGFLKMPEPQYHEEH